MKTTKRLTAALLAALMIFGTQMLAFAAVDSSEDESEAEGTSEAADANEDADDTDAGEDADEGDETDDATTTAEATGTVNESPDTGVSAAPFAAALLAAASVPVIVKTRKRK